MNQTLFAAIRARINSVWDVAIGRAYAGYEVFDSAFTTEIQLRAALLEIEQIVEDKADVDDGTPNDAMRILVLARGTLSSLTALERSHDLNR